jgi:hypothetical protein
MSSICNVYATDSVSEFESLVNTCGWAIDRDLETQLSIVRWQPSANTDIVPSVKGLIYDSNTGEILAAGLPVPLETMPAEAKVIAHSRALDGITVRFWYNPKQDAFTYSTSGMIIPGEWQDHDISTLVQSCLTLPENRINLDKLAKNYTYVVVMEHPIIPNIYKADKPRLTLTRILDTAGNSLDLNTNENTTHFANVDKLHDPEAMPFVTRTDGVDRDTFGVMCHLADGRVFRKLSPWATEAETFRPNYSNVWQHWIYHVRGTKPDEWDFTGVYWYKKYFPWNAAQIDGLCAFFLATVPPPEHYEMLDSPADLKRIADMFYQKLKSIEEDWVYTLQPDGIQVVVGVPMLGDFPNEECAQRVVRNILANPAQLFK